MPIAASNGVEICYEAMGAPGDPTILLVAGLGSQMISWHDDLCAALVARGHRVVRFDNRDTGLSTHVDGRRAAAAPGPAAAAGAPQVPYLLADLADDAVAVLDALAVERAHVVGMSMGGMIAQVVAIGHTTRVASLTSIMSTTGDADVGTPTPEALAALTAPPAATREASQDAAVHHAHVWGSPGLFDEALLRDVAGRAWDRDGDSSGTARQLAAIVASGSRSAELARLDVPTLVVHGTADTLVQPSGGRRTAEVIPGAELLMIEGMGHDLAPPLWPRLIDAVVAHVADHP
ncbi:MAG TPA: alpha/beta fold hydrolase [Acidimicrobiales bacterium]|nr:alpha/beta fold hydrolase [Acidimicrobiales bacterium]